METITHTASALMLSAEADWLMQRVTESLDEGGGLTVRFVEKAQDSLNSWHMFLVMHMCLGVVLLSSGAFVAFEEVELHVHVFGQKGVISIIARGPLPLLS